MGYSVAQAAVRHLVSVLDVPEGYERLKAQLAVT
jgi:hypothetical protein